MKLLRISFALILTGIAVGIGGFRQVAVTLTLTGTLVAAVGFTWLWVEDERFVYPKRLAVLIGLFCAASIVAAIVLYGKYNEPRWSVGCLVLAVLCIVADQLLHRRNISVQGRHN